MKVFKSIVIFLVSATLLTSCGEATSNDSNQATEKELDIAKLEQVLGMKGVSKDGEYKITVPQNDLNVVVDNFKIIPPMGLGSWAAFTSAPDGAMVMGDIVVTETDLKPVQEEVIRQGLTVTIIETAGGPGLLLYKKEPFRNFILRADWRVTDVNDNSGIYIRVPDIENGSGN